MTTTVYVLFVGEYDDKRIADIYATQALADLAQRAHDKYQGNEPSHIEEYEVQTTV